jgi:hypothetical protein
LISPPAIISSNSFSALLELDLMSTKNSVVEIQSRKVYTDQVRKENLNNRKIKLSNIEQGGVDTKGKV